MLRLPTTATDGSTPQNSGVVLGILPASPNYGIQLQLTSALSSDGSPATSAARDCGYLASAPSAGIPFFDYEPLDGLPRFYRGRHVDLVNATVDPGAWTVWAPASSGTGVKPTLVPTNWESMGVPTFAVYPVFRTVAMSDGRYAASADDGSGSVITTTVSQTDGVNPRAIVKGFQQGSGRHGDSVVFATAFQNVPQVSVSGGIGYQPNSVWSATGATSGTAAPTTNAQYNDYGALGVSAAGFTIRARMRQKGTATEKDVEFLASGAGLLSTAGATAAVGTSAAPSRDDTYKVCHYQTCDLVAGSSKFAYSRTTVVAIDSSTDGASWTERYTKSWFCNGAAGTTEQVLTGVDQATLTVAALTSAAQFRVRIKSITDVGAFTVNSFYVRGCNNSTDAYHGVQYYVATDQYASKTPDADDSVQWQAWSVS